MSFSFLLLFSYLFYIIETLEEQSAKMPLSHSRLNFALICGHTEACADDVKHKLFKTEKNLPKNML